MPNELQLDEISPKGAKTVPSATQVAVGIPIPAVRLIQVMSPEDWEQFTEEWLYFHKANGTYESIKRISGAGDRGLDVVAFTTSNGFAQPWDSFQCKKYNHALEPNDIYREIGKIIYHSYQGTPPFSQACPVPRRHVFICPLGVGLTVGQLLKDHVRLKQEVRSKWDSHCVPAIGTGIVAPLTGALLTHFNAFNFSIFEDRTALELIAEHAQTIFHAARFGGGLPPREEPDVPPAEPNVLESRYLRQLLDAYGDHLGKPVGVRDELAPHPSLDKHYNRQRILFYSAESLRNFARDRTPPRTFDSLQDDVFNGVIDVCDAEYADSLERVKTTVSTAAQIDVGGNALAGVTKVADKQGICHQLANDDRLTWSKKS